MTSLKARRLAIVEGESDFIYQVLQKFCKFTVDDSNFRQIRKNLSYLGQNFSSVGYDGTRRIIPELLHSLLGTVKSGGLFFLGVSSLDNLVDPRKFADEDLIRFKTGSKNKVQNNFLKRMVDNIRSCSRVIYINRDNLPDLAEELSESITAAEATNQDIQPAVDPVLRQSLQEVKAGLIYGPRGSGKSTLLSALGRELICQGKKITVTGPSRQGASEVLKRIPQALFQGIDDLLHKGDLPDYILIDEAGSIPLPKLKELILKSNRIIAAGTSEGYEGTGTGFDLKLQEFLQDQNITTFKTFLHNSYRFDNDELAQLWRTIFAPAPATAPAPVTADPIPSKEITLSHICSTDLAENEDLLKQTYYLLSTNHYQTRPSDLRQLLDSPVNHLFYALNGDKVIGVLWGDIEEGNEKLLEEIFCCRRRPQGNLLPQTLIAHCGFRNACFYRFFRTIRIVIRPEQRRRGLGSRLLQFAEEEMSNCCDFFGTSFGATVNLLSFWHSCNYEAVKLGLREDSSSGLYSAVMLHTRGKLKQRVMEEWRNSFLENLLPAASWQFKDLDPLLLANLFSEKRLQMPRPTNYRKDLYSISRGLRSPELCLASVLTWIAESAEEWRNWPQKDQYLLTGYFLQHRQDISSQDREFITLRLREAIADHLDRLKEN